MIYLDYSATTPVREEVIDTYSRVCREFIGNPNSLHKLGIKAKKIIAANIEPAEVPANSVKQTPFSNADSYAPMKATALHPPP